MYDYNFLADLLATFRASPDSIKALWLIVPPSFTLAVIGLLAWAVRLRMRPKPEAAPGQSRALVLDHEDFDAPAVMDDSFSHLPAPRPVLADALDTDPKSD
ncbi:hypothetical protein ACFSE1_00130 [Rhizobium helianthi]|uniref:Cbb3-type cytochrome c oxidase subunit 3 n=1 Tax=Rhizobium helianthi TaxID=1132695 RepID=A0ABW4LZ80_9HYPH